MPCTKDNTQRIARIRRMELRFNTLLAAAAADPQSVHRDAVLRRQLAELIRYYESPLWLADYDADARGELPQDLRRGVLSEDGVYNLLADLAACDTPTEE
ncbi:MAG: DUF4298 domain-containing protein [Clostridia bacterium]|nr:DUF4298 domain-containing protein [Clostridia bacterium]